MKETVMKEHMKERFGKVFNYSNNPPFPSCINIEINNHCNQSCIFCGFHGKYASHVPQYASMDFETIKRIIDEVHKNGGGKKELGFYLAGEVFLHKDLITAVAYAKKVGFPYIFITTNGALASHQKMKDILDAGLDSIRFSVNAADKDTYATIHGRDDFYSVVDNIKFCNKYIKENNLKVATSLSCVITKKTNGIQSRMKELFGEFVDDILFIPVRLDRLLCDDKFICEYQIVDDSNAEINHNYICPLLFDTMYISADLKVLPCCESYAEGEYFYDLKEDFNLENAWNCDAYKRHREIFLNNADDSGTICEKCFLRKSGVERLGV